MAAWVILDLVKAYHKPARIISNENSFIFKNERRICTRVGHFYFQFDDETYELSDFHFMRQVNTGGWAQKHGAMPSQYDGFIDPDEDSDWILLDEQYYNSKTIYMAM